MEDDIAVVARSPWRSKRRTPGIGDPRPQKRDSAQDLIDMAAWHDVQVFMTTNRTIGESDQISSQILKEEARRRS